MDDYYGSRLLAPLSDATGIQIDKLNFVICQLCGLCVAPLMRKCLPAGDNTKTMRHLLSSLLGLVLVIFCFGRSTWHVVILSTACYFIIIQRRRHMQYMVFIISLLYLGFIHTYRMISNYGAYTLDITGPLMGTVQKVTGLAFALYDGFEVQPEELPPFRKKYAVKKVPTLLEYFGFMFQFQGVLAGPVVSYVDYSEYIEGQNFKKHPNPNNNSQEPSAKMAIISKLLSSVSCAVVFLVLSPYFTVDTVRDESFLDWPLWKKMVYLTVMTNLTRFMYYHAWTLADAVCNASGLGFSGYDDKGQPVWDITTNVKIREFELANNLRQSINAWNIGTNAWLRYIVYERVRRYKTLFTFLLSAVWHGFYPGYYLTFITASLFVSSARVVRRFVRPWFLDDGKKKMLYDTLTTLSTKLAMTYMTFPFVLYELTLSLIILKSMYFFMHISGIMILILLPTLAPKISRIFKGEQE